MGKKITFFIAIAISIGIVSGGIELIASCGTNKSLVEVWGQREDLQKAFPGSPYCNSGLEKWAKEYGWKEDNRLISYSPFGSIFDSLQKRISELEKKINEPKQQPVYTPTPTTQTGEWRKCCGYTSGSLRCDEEMQLRDCQGNQYEIYILSK